jgi:hypothetical protein
MFWEYFLSQKIKWIGRHLQTETQDMGNAMNTMKDRKWRFASKIFVCFQSRWDGEYARHF